MFGTENKGTGRIVIALLIGLVQCAVAGTYGGGSGTAEDPYQIRDANQMQAIGAEPDDWDKHFILMDDIDLSPFTGTQFNLIREFSGVFNGNNHTISNFTYESPTEDEVGLFASVVSNSSSTPTIENLRLANVNVTGDDMVGALAGRIKNGSSARIHNCHVVGGLLTGVDEVGGLIGHCQDAQLTDCFAIADVSGAMAIGGLVGEGLYDMNHMTDCYAMCNVSGSTRVGGLIGYNYGDIERCFTNSDIAFDSFGGGLVGSNYGSISNSYAQGTVLYGFESVGGFAGANSGAISNCYASCVSDSGYTDGFVGWPECCDHPQGQVHDSYWDIDISGLTVSHDGGAPKTTGQLHQESTFTNWDFLNVWDIGENQTYPYLRTHAASDLNKDNMTNFLDLGILAEQWMDGQF